MTEADRDDIIFELHLADTEADRNATLVRLVWAYHDLREDLVDHWCEIVLAELRAALNPEPEPPCPPVDKDVAAQALARFRRRGAEILANRDLVLRSSYIWRQTLRENLSP